MSMVRGTIEDIVVWFLTSLRSSDPPFESEQSPQDGNLTYIMMKWHIILSTLRLLWCYEVIALLVTYNRIWIA
jgi:hypothetical protein